MSLWTVRDYRMRSLRWAQAALLIAVLGAGCGGGSAPRFHETAGGFSYCPPAKWTPTVRAGLTYRICTAPAQDGLTPNIVFIDEETSMPLEAYADQYVGIAGRIAGSAPKRDAFRTEDGAAGFRWRFEQTMALPGQRLRQTQYVFGNGQRKCLITCTAAADGGAAFDGVFAECMKTFRFDH